MRVARSAKYVKHFELVKTAFACKTIEAALTYARPTRCRHRAHKAVERRASRRLKCVSLRAPVCAPTSSCACSPTMPHAPTALLFDDEEPDVAEAARPSVVAPAEAHHRPKTKPDANAPPRASLCTASGPCSTIWPRLPTTASSLPWLMPSPSTSSLDRPRCSAKLSSCSGFAWNVPSNAFANFLFHSEKQQVDSRMLSKFSLESEVGMSTHLLRTPIHRFGRECVP